MCFVTSVEMFIYLSGLERDDHNVGFWNGSRSPFLASLYAAMFSPRLLPFIPTHESHQILEQPNWLSLLAFWCILEGHQPTFNHHLSRECLHIQASSHSFKRCCLRVIKHFVSLSPLQISVYYLILRNENIVEHRVEMTLVKTPIVIFLQIFACEMLHWLHLAYLSHFPLMYFPSFPLQLLVGDGNPRTNHQKVPHGARAYREPTELTSAITRNDRFSHENRWNLDARCLHGDCEINRNLRDHHAALQDDEFG